MFNGGYVNSSDSEDVPLNSLFTENSDLGYDCLIKTYEVCCDFCEKIFTNRYEALKHTKNHIIIPLIQPKLIQCPICLCYFISEIDYKRHEIRKHTISLKNRIRFESDDEEHEKETRNKLNNLYNIGCYRCKHCLMIFSTRYKLSIHNITHIHITLPKVYLCAICEGFYEDKIQLKYHLIRAHNNVHMPNNILNKCTKCNLSYNDYSTHKARYHFNYMCEVCKRPFPTKKSLHIHSNWHSKMVKCQQCDVELVASEMDSHVQDIHCRVNICDMCLLFVKRHKSYVIIGEENVAEERIQCAHCLKLFYRLNVVKRVRVSKPIRFNEKRIGKSFTNVDRLKSIKGRLRKINLLNKF